VAGVLGILDSLKYSLAYRYVGGFCRGVLLGCEISVHDAAGVDYGPRWDPGAAFLQSLIISNEISSCLAWTPPRTSTSKCTGRRVAGGLLVLV
jgi:hypothetical protein